MIIHTIIDENNSANKLLSLRPATTSETRLKQKVAFVILMYSVNVCVSYLKIKQTSGKLSKYTIKTRF